MEVSKGTVIAGRYRLAERLGGGGMGEVWKARDQRLRVDVAAKRLILDPHATIEERRTALTYAEKESRHAAALRAHPNVVAVHDVVEDDDGIPWTVMDLVTGRSLAQAVAAGERFEPDHAARIGLQVLGALAAAHAIGITHRDVKPGNIMLADDGSILLVDFGIAKHHADTRITRTGLAVGTVEYMAPERFDGDDGPTGDLWALGVTLYEAVSGISPFRRDSLMATIQAIGRDDLPRPASAGWMAEPIMRLLDKEAHARPTTAQAKALLEDGQDSGTAAPAPEPPAPRPPLSTAQGELFERAIQIAESIRDPDERESALYSVGVSAPSLREEIMPRLSAENRLGLQLELALEAADAVLARRLLDQAGALIALIPDPEEQAASHQQHIIDMSRAAGLLSKVDPAGARQLMEQVESAAHTLPPNPDYTWVLPDQLVEIAKQGRDADPHASRRLINLAEHRALGLDEQEDRNWALGRVSAGVAPVDPDRAERLIGMITERYEQVHSWQESIEAAVSAGCGHVPDLIDAAELALVGPARAAMPTSATPSIPVPTVAAPAQTEERTSGWWRRLRRTRQPDPMDADLEELIEELETEEEEDSTSDLVGIAVAAAAADSSRAERLASRITTHAARAKALTGMAGQVAASDPAQARQWLATAHEAALGIPKGPYSGRPEALGAVAAEAADLDHDLATGVTRHLVSSLGKHVEVWTLVIVAEYIAAVDPAQAVRLVDQAESRTEPLDAGPRRHLALALVTAAVALADTDLQYAKSLVRRAWQAVHRPPEVEEYVELTWWPLRALAVRDLHTAEQLLDQLPSSDQEPLLTHVVSELMESDPRRAEQAAQRITDDTARKQALVQAALAIATNAQGCSSVEEKP
ncbi:MULTISPECIES: serine/threonine-protein kinase [unclassified Streptomyces]|uniref:serine/threonine-protein kinase n=1 Tax=unclassified Streptomyces TaxID=2593676 RepID=UPI00131C961C|nr:serine/threonine-protein kinase [Streptomyces sp. CB01635]